MWDSSHGQRWRILISASEALEYLANLTLPRTASKRKWTRLNTSFPPSAQGLSGDSRRFRFWLSLWHPVYPLNKLRRPLPSIHLIPQFPPALQFVEQGAATDAEGFGGFSAIEIMFAQCR